MRRTRTFDDALASSPADAPRLARKDHLTFKANRAQGRHGWLRLTPAYSLHLVERLVAGLPTRDTVLDPFCGTATTALACAQNGIACDTVDVNPFLVWFAAAKCAAYTDAELARVGAFADALEPASLREAGAWTPPIQDVHKWWPEPLLAALATLFARISAEGCDRARDLLRIGFCRAAIETASVSFGHQSMSFRRSEPRTPLVGDAAAAKVHAHFSRALADVTRSAAETPSGRARAVLGDSRELDRCLPHARYTAVITSPPYPNRMSYVRELRPYMYWLGHLRDGRQAGELDWKAIGGTWGCATSLVAKWHASPGLEVPWAGFDGCVRAIKGHSDLLGRYVHKYFEDAVLHVRSLARVLAPGARIHYVVGNSKFYDVLLPTEEIYAAIFGASGYGDVAIERIRKRTSKKELFEFVVHATRRGRE